MNKDNRPLHERFPYSCKPFDDPIFKEECDGTFSINKETVEAFREHGYEILTEQMYSRLVSSMIDECVADKTRKIDAHTFSNSAVLDAMRYRTPAKPIMVAQDGFTAEEASILSCPACKNPLINYYRPSIHPPCCMMCGQVIDWSDDNDEL